MVGCASCFALLDDPDEVIRRWKGYLRPGIKTVFNIVSIIRTKIFFTSSGIKNGNLAFREQGGV